jgi:flagellar motor switch protein FliM
MARLSTQVWVVSNRRRNATPESRAAILGTMKLAPVKVTAVLGETAVTVEELINLQVGDVLMFGGGPALGAQLHVVNQRRFTGVPGLIGGRRAVRITGIDGVDTDKGEADGDG